MIIQRLMGLTLIALGVISAAVTNDSTAAFIVVPMGLYATLTKEKITTFNGDIINR